MAATNSVIASVVSLAAEAVINSSKLWCCTLLSSRWKEKKSTPSMTTVDGILHGTEQAVLSLICTLTLSWTVFISYHCVLMVQRAAGAVKDKSSGARALWDMHTYRSPFLLSDLLKTPRVTMETSLSLAVIVTLTQSKRSGLSAAASHSFAGCIWMTCAPVSGGYMLHETKKYT